MKIKVKITGMDRQTVVLDDIDKANLNSEGTVLCIYRVRNIGGSPVLTNIIPLENVREVEYL